MSFVDAVFIVAAGGEGLLVFHWWLVAEISHLHYLLVSDVLAVKQLRALVSLTLPWAVVLRTGSSTSSAASGNLLEMHVWAPPRPTESETWKLGTGSDKHSK